MSVDSLYCCQQLLLHRNPIADSFLKSQLPVIGLAIMTPLCLPLQPLPNKKQSHLNSRLAVAPSLPSSLQLPHRLTLTKNSSTTLRTNWLTSFLMGCSFLPTPPSRVLHLLQGCRTRCMMVSTTMNWEIPCTTNDSPVCLLLHCPSTESVHMVLMVLQPHSLHSLRCALPVLLSHMFLSTPHESPCP